MSRSPAHGSSDRPGPSRFPPPPQTRAAIREWDRRAIEEYGIPGIVLMENAGAGAARAIEAIIAGGTSLPEPFRIICGPGKNGGDGFVVARHLRNAGIDVRVDLAGSPAYATGSDPAVNLEIVRRFGIQVSPSEGPPGASPLEGTIIDALFGTGLSRPLEPPFLDWVLAIESSGCPVIALDVPSGLDADTGEPLGAAVEAIHTLTFAAAKVGFTRGSGPRFTGNVQVIDIGLPRELWSPSP